VNELKQHIEKEKINPGMETIWVNRSNKSSSISCSSSSFGSLEQSHSMRLSPPASSSPRRDFDDVYTLL